MFKEIFTFFYNAVDVIALDLQNQNIQITCETVEQFLLMQQVPYLCCVFIK